MLMLIIAGIIMSTMRKIARTLNTIPTYDLSVCSLPRVKYVRDRDMHFLWALHKIIIPGKPIFYVSWSPFEMIYNLR